MKKAILSFLLCGMMAIGLVACGGNDASSEAPASESTPASVSTSVAESVSTPEAPEAAPEAPSSAPADEIAASEVSSAA